MYLFILILLIIIFIVKYLTNKETIDANCKDENDLANIKYARKYYTKTKTSFVALIISLIMLIVLLLSQYTDIDKYIIDYLSTEFYQEKTLDTTLYYIPIYIIIMRFIVIEVKVGDYLYKYFKVEEPHLEENPLKSILYKKKPGEGNIPKETNEQTERNEQIQTEQKETTEIKEPQQETPTLEIQDNNELPKVIEKDVNQ